MPAEKTKSERRAFLEALPLSDLQTLADGGDDVAEETLRERLRIPRSQRLAKVLRILGEAVERRPAERWESEQTYSFLRFACYEVCDGGGDSVARNAIDDYFDSAVCPRCEAEQLDEMPDEGGASYYKLGHREGTP